MTKLLRTLPDPGRGWTTKPQDATGALTHEELDQLMLDLENDAYQVGTAILEDEAAPLMDGWLRLDGGTFVQGDYPELYALLGGSTTLPDLTGTEPSTALEWRIKGR